MKKDFTWQIFLGAVLISASVFVYGLHYFIFRDLHHIFIYLIGDIAFLFLEVFIVTLVLHRFLNARDKKTQIKKMNMIVGVFFSEAGMGLLERLSAFDPEAAKIARKVCNSGRWKQKEFKAIHAFLKKHHHHIDARREDIIPLKNFLVEKRAFFLNLLQNPNLLEHESFTNLLWSTFHLIEEMIQRGDLSMLSDDDYKHLLNDIRRVYRYLIFEWIGYMMHLSTNYPYLFSFALRTNPFTKYFSEIK